MGCPTLNSGPFEKPVVNDLTVINNLPLITASVQNALKSAATQIDQATDSIKTLNDTNITHSKAVDNNNFTINLNDVDAAIRTDIAKLGRTFYYLNDIKVASLVQADGTPADGEAAADPTDGKDFELDFGGVFPADKTFLQQDKQKILELKAGHRKIKIEALSAGSADEDANNAARVGITLLQADASTAGTASNCGGKIWCKCSNYGTDSWGRVEVLSCVFTRQAPAATTNLMVSNE